MAKLNLEKTDDITGTSLMGALDISYYELVAKLGPPHSDGDGYKVDAEWGFILPSGKTVTIYNYKTGKNYDPSGLPVELIRDWHIGGKDASVVDELVKLLDEAEAA